MDNFGNLFVNCECGRNIYMEVEIKNAARRRVLIQAALKLVSAENAKAYHARERAYAGCEIYDADKFPRYYPVLRG